MVFIYLVLWFTFLVIWGNLLISWASHVAKRLGISELIIWLTIVALWTSTPELVVNIQSALQGNTNLAMANVLGSNISNIFLILWIVSIIVPISIKRNVILYDIPFMIFVLVVFMIFVITPLDVVTMESLRRSDALILLLFWWVFAYYLYFTSQWDDLWFSWEVCQKQHYIVSLWYILCWLLGLMYGWEMVVNNAIKIANDFVIPERIVGVTMLALWTSLPELVTSVVAWVRGKTDLAVWNIVWSNILNITFVLAITWIISVIPFDNSSRLDLYAALLASIVLLLLSYIYWPNLTRRKWAILLWCYIAYIYFFVLL